MNERLLDLFTEYLEKQDMLSKLTEHEKLHAYGYSEIHVIAAIGDMDAPNVTSIAGYMHMTKGAISKIIKKCISAVLIVPYMIDGNNQKVFYRLTENGRFLYDEHGKRHELWGKRDLAFFSRYTARELETIAEFMADFNIYLEDKIKNREKHSDVN